MTQDERSLFDFDEDQAVALDAEVDEPEWREVPAALFLSWSDARQLAYCAARDEVTMLDENDDVSDWWLAFYAERTIGYRQDMKQ